MDRIIKIKKTHTDEKILFIDNNILQWVKKKLNYLKANICINKTRV